MTDRRLPPGRQPYDALNGLRVGAIAGALIGGGLLVLIGWEWFLPIGAAAGGLGGYLWERRQ